VGESQNEAHLNEGLLFLKHEMCIANTIWWIEPVDFREGINRSAAIYERGKHVERCILTLLPKPGLFCKRENGTGQSGESWKEARAVHVQKRVESRRAAPQETMLEELCKEEQPIIMLVTLLCYGRPR